MGGEIERRQTERWRLERDRQTKMGGGRGEIGRRETEAIDISLSSAYKPTYISQWEKHSLSLKRHVSSNQLSITHSDIYNTGPL